MYNDIAKAVANPFKGQIFNAPSTGPGVDVYANAVLDYTGLDVTPENFLNVIEGNATAMAGIGSGRVLKSTRNDTVFINFVDHGGVGIICFPYTNLKATRLNKALATMYQTNMYDKLVFYLESCESGSMFENILPTDLNIYVTTAANAEESSWGTYW
jgi:legumain